MIGKKKKSKNDRSNNAGVWTEEEYEEYLKELYGMEFIAGFTENSVPYGIFKDEDKENDELGIRDNFNNELPF